MGKLVATSTAKGMGGVNGRIIKLVPQSDLTAFGGVAVGDEAPVRRLFQQNVRLQ